MGTYFKPALLLFTLLVCVTVSLTQTYGDDDYNDVCLDDNPKDQNCPNVCPRNIQPVCTINYNDDNPKTYDSYCLYRKARYCDGAPICHIDNEHCGL